MDATCRLITYGSLAPGQSNHHQLDGLQGRWLTGSVRGRLLQAGWGADLGYPALILESDGPVVEVHIFESVDLPGHWPRLDEFEGAGYRRVIATADTIEGDLEASIYVLNPATQ
jgi:gamma-glutamylcyclotransferase (GGCT)/AIG2-like uncharacterized protein YtfP